MKNVKMRLLALVLILVFASLIYVNWRTLITDGHYSLKMAAFGPVGVVGGFYLLVFPGKGGKPQTTKDKIVAMVVFLIGVGAGLLNWYLMDAGAFLR
jgi:NhaP-type Na+/H+ or K+/H+ antiporter